MKTFKHLLVVLLLAGPSVAHGEERSSDLWHGTADDAVAYALKHNPLMGSAKSDIAISQSALTAAWGRYIPRLEFTSLLTAIPAMRGDAVSGYTDYDDWGPLFRVEMGGQMPLYAFGQLAALRDVAEAGVDVSEAEYAVTAAELAFQTRRAVLGGQLGEAVLEIVNEGEKYLKRAKRRLEEEEEADEPDFDQVDLLKIRVYEADVVERKAAIEMGLAEARHGLKLAMGLPQDSRIELSEKKLVIYKFSLADLEFYLRLARENRPELEVQRAKEHRARTKSMKARRSLMPRLGLDAFYRYAISPNSDDQLSPFAYDPYNEHEVGVGLTLKWTFDLGQQLAEMDKAQAVLRRETSRSKSVENQMEAEVSRVYSELKAQRQLVKVNKRALKSARGWLVAKSDLYDSGFGSLDDVADALVEFYTRKIGYQQAVHDANLATLRMGRLVGVDVWTLGPDLEPPVDHSSVAPPE